MLIWSFDPAIIFQRHKLELIKHLWSCDSLHQHSMRIQTVTVIMQTLYIRMYSLNFLSV